MTAAQPVYAWGKYAAIEPGGIREFDSEYDTAWSCARRLARYITDPTTIRAYIVSNFGPVAQPTVAQIRAMRCEVERRREGLANWLGVERAGDDIDFVADKTPHKLKLVRASRGLHPEKIAEPEPLVLPEPGTLCTALDVIAASARSCGVSAKDVINRGRQRKIVPARCLAIAVLTARGNSFAQTGKRLDDRNHSTIVHLCRQFFDRELRDDTMVRRWEALAPEGFAHIRTYDALMDALAERGVRPDA